MTLLANWRTLFHAPAVYYEIVDQRLATFQRSGARIYSARYIVVTRPLPRNGGHGRRQ